MRLTESVLGRPAFLYAVILGVCAWIGLNLGLHASGHAPLDPPPFPWLQGIVSWTALLTTSSVLIAQRRQDRHSERREHLNLQVSLLVEQEVTKVIGLLEEMRRDLPSLQNRVDPEADHLSQATDTAALIGELDRVLAETEQSLQED